MLKYKTRVCWTLQLLANKLIEGLGLRRKCMILSLGLYSSKEGP